MLKAHGGSWGLLLSPQRSSPKGAGASLVLFLEALRRRAATSHTRPGGWERSTHTTPENWQRSLLPGGSRLMPGAEPGRCGIGSLPSPSAQLPVFLQDTSQRAARGVPCLLLPRWVHFHRFLFILCTHLHGLRGLEGEPVPGRDCPHRLPSIGHIFRPRCRTRTPPSSVPRVHSVLCLIFIHGIPDVIGPLATAGSRIIFRPLGTAPLPVSLQPTLSVITGPPARPRPAAAVHLRGRSAPHIALAPMIFIIIASGPGTRHLLGTAVSCAGGTGP